MSPVLQSNKSRLVGWRNLETTEGLRTDSPAVDVDSHKYRLQLVRTSSRLHSRMRFLRTDTFRDKKSIESCCTVFQLKVFQKKELQAERDFSPAMAQKMQDEDCGSDCKTRANNSNSH